MLNTKRLFSFTLTAFFIMSAAAARAQDSGGAATQQQASLNLMVFKGIYGPDGLTIRKKTLESINDAVEQGNTSDEIYDALEYLSMEGIKNRAMIRGQLLNNYPDIRQMAAAQLGRMGTAKATELLIQLCNAEKLDLYVLRDTIKALGDIGINENDITIRTIIWNVRNFNPSRPDSVTDRVVYSAVDALDKIEKKNEGIKNQKDFIDVQDFLKRVSDGHFSTPVRDRAKQALEDILRRNSERK
jgi:hypothetical protein